MTKIAVSISFSLLCLLFLIGIAHILLSFKRSKNILVFLRLVLILIFFLPFLLYFLAGTINIRFGWARNFFYLLPIYLLTIFYGLKTLVGNKRYYYIISTIILAFLLSTGIAGRIAWETVNLEREMVRYAAKIDYSSIILFSRKTAIWPFQYYIKKYGAQNRVLFLHEGATAMRQSMILEKIPDTKIFAIIEMVKAGALIKEDKYSLGAESFEIVKRKEYKVRMGPFQFFFQFVKKMSGYHSPRIVIYFCKKA